jgi:UDP-2-acetamido-2,6-beta-L-arabino-hexul-4-ose reductase
LQVSINISRPNITKGNHWHNSKWEQFTVASGHGLIQERNIDTGEFVEFGFSGDKIEVVYIFLVGHITLSIYLKLRILLPS